MLSKIFGKLPTCDSPITLCVGFIAGLVIVIEAVIFGGHLWVIRFIFGIVLMVHVAHMMWFYKNYGRLNELVALKIKNSQ